MKKIIAVLLIAGGALYAAGKQILIDGSSTVFPITEAVAEEYRKVDSSINVTVGTSGTGGGFKKFCNGEIQISDASRPIKKEEAAKCAEKGIQFVELPIAYDGLAVMVNPKNTFVSKLTVEELKKIFDAQSTATTWKDINEKWPAEPIKIYAPGKDSGTFDYFVEEIVGKKGQVKSTATFSEDDNVLVRGISGDKNGIGFFGLAYYEENASSLKLIPVVNPKTKIPTIPSIKTVVNGSYFPLSRPLFIYVEKSAASEAHVKSFVDFYLNNAAKLSKEVGYIPLGADVYAIAKKRFATMKLGTAYITDMHGKTLAQIFR